MVSDESKSTVLLNGQNLRQSLKCCGIRQTIWCFASCLGTLCAAFQSRVQVLCEHRVLEGRWMFQYVQGKGQHVTPGSPAPYLGKVEWAMGIGQCWLAFHRASISAESEVGASSCEPRQLSLCVSYVLRNPSASVRGGQGPAILCSSMSEMAWCPEVFSAKACADMLSCNDWEVT